MSLFKPMNLRCPNCGAENNVEIAGSINADRRPDFRDAIMANHFQDATCDVCGTSFRTEPEFNYLDAGRGQWIAALPARLMVDHLVEEDRCREAFDRSYGAGAPAAAREIGEGLSVRVTFGWPALREKLLAREREMDDVALECLKLDLMRRLPEAPLAPGIELRMVRADDTALDMVWLDAMTEEVISEFSVKRPLWDAIAGNPEPWAAIRAKLCNGPFVDMQKLYMGEGREAEAGAG